MITAWIFDRKIPLQCYFLSLFFIYSQTSNIPDLDNFNISSLVSNSGLNSSAYQVKYANLISPKYCKDHKSHDYVPFSSLSWITESFSSFSWLKPSETFEYPLPTQEPKVQSLQQITGFQYCSHLNFAVFDVDNPLKIDVISALLDELNSLGRPFDSSNTLYQLVLSRRFALMFSPTLETEKIFPSVESPLYKHSSIREMGNADFVRLIDFIAEIIAKRVVAHYHLSKIQYDRFMDSFISAPIDPSSAAKRFACFMAADGSNDWVDLSVYKRKLLRFIDGRIYFEHDINFQMLDMKDVNHEAQHLHYQWKACKEGYHPINNEPEVDHEPRLLHQKEFQDFKESLLDMPTNSSSSFKSPFSEQVIEVKPHKIAYLLLVHKSYENVLNLLESLIDPYATILLHVDAKNMKLKRRLIVYLEQMLKKNPSYKRVKLLEKSFNGLWGSSSLVFSQLEGFFELLGVDNDWDYVVNLSGFDYPLRSNDIIYQELERLSGKNMSSFIGHWTSYDAVSRVHDYPLLPSTDQFVGKPSDIASSAAMDPITINGHEYASERIDAFMDILRTKEFGQLSFPYSHWPLYKHHQWMILHRSFVEHLRRSPTAMYVAAFMEWSMIPDESYFATVGKNSPSFKPNIINDSKRFLEFPVGASHPRAISLHDLPILFDQVFEGKAYYTRKVDMGREDGWTLVRGIEKIKLWDRQTYGRDLNYTATYNIT